ncbi:Adenylosuccinate synthetase [Bienertia sinuspersici]
MSFESGLRNVYSDSEVREMVYIAYENRLLDLYVVYGVDKPKVLNDLGPSIHEPLSPKCTPSQKTNKKKLTLKKAPQAVNKCLRQQKDFVSLTPNYSHVPNKVVSISDFNNSQIEQDSPLKATDNPNFFIPTQSSQAPTKSTSSKPEDPRPNSTLRWQDLIYGDEESDGDESDPDYMLENDNELEEEDSSDDELRIAREKVKSSEAKLIELAQQLQREAGEGRLGKKKATDQGKGQTWNEENQDEGIVSEYEDSRDEINTPASSDGGHYRSKKR